MTYKEWLTTEAGMRWEKAIKSFVPDYSDLKAVVHITQDVFHASKNAVEAEMRIDDKVAAERERCVNIVQTTEDVYDPGHPDDELMTFADFRRFCKQIISEIRGAE